MSTYGGGGPTMVEPTDCVQNAFYSRRDMSFGSVGSAGDMRGSQTSLRHGSRFSCLSSVRDEQQTLDELRRKQRVVRYMYEEREQAERGQIECDEHLDWINLCILERQERFKFLSVQQVTDYLRCEVQELERERLFVEETLQRRAKTALQGRHAAANSKSRSESQEKPANVSLEDKAVGGEHHLTDVSPAMKTTGENSENLDALKCEYKRREEELLANLHTAQNDAAASRAKVEDAMRRLALAEEKQLQLAARAEEETAAKRRAEERVKDTEKRMDELLKKILDMNKELQTVKGEYEKNVTVLSNLEEQLKFKQEQLSFLQREKEDLTAKCNTLLATNATLTERLSKMHQDNDSVKQLPQPPVGKRLIKVKLTPQQRAAIANSEVVEVGTNPSNTVRSIGENFTSLKKEEGSSEKRVVELERLEQAEKDAMKHKAEAEAAREELDKIRENYDREIASLQEWCYRLNEKCNRQTDELRNRILRGEICDSSDNCKNNDVDSKEGDPTVFWGAPQAENSERIAGLMQELNVTREQLKETQEREKCALELIETLQKRAQNFQIAKQDDGAALRGTHGFLLGNGCELKGTVSAEQGEHSVRNDQRGAPLAATAQSVSQSVVLQSSQGLGVDNAAPNTALNADTCGARENCANGLHLRQELNERVRVGVREEHGNATTQQSQAWNVSGVVTGDKPHKEKASSCCLFSCKKKKT